EDLRHWEWRYLHHRLNGGKARQLTCAYDVTSLAYSSDGQHLAASAGAEGNEPRGEVRIWPWDNLSGETRLTGFVGPVRQIAFSPTGRLLAAITSTLERNPQGGELRLYSRVNGSLVWKRPYAPGCLFAVAFPADDASLLVLDRDGLRKIDADSGGALPD